MPFVVDDHQPWLMKGIAGIDSFGADQPFGAETFSRVRASPNKFHSRTFLNLSTSRISVGFLPMESARSTKFSLVNEDFVLAWNHIIRNLQKLNQ